MLWGAGIALVYMPFVLKRKALRGKRSFEINRFSASVFFRKKNQNKTLPL